MDIQLKTASSNTLQKGIRKVIALLRHHLEGTPDSMATVQIHQVAAKGSARFMFNVMGHEDATLVIIWPEPNKRNSPIAVRPNRERHELRAQIVHRLIDRPAWEFDICAPPQI